MKKVCIIGLGLIGGSIGMDIKSRGIAETVFGVARREETIEHALKEGAIGQGSTDYKQGIAGADLVILAMPVKTIIEYSNLLAQEDLGNTIVTDVGSTKTEIVKIDEKIPNFVGSHPMSGSEKTGIDNADSDLFEGKVCILTKSKNTKQDALQTVEKFWQQLGSKTYTMSPEEHDKIIAQVSHLPHIIATTLVESTDKDNIQYAGAGFFDTTRIASGSSVMWDDIYATNKENILQEIKGFQGDLEKFVKTIAPGSSDNE